MKEKTYILAVKETDTADKKQLLKRKLITRYTIIGATIHSKYRIITNKKRFKIKSQQNL